MGLFDTKPAAGKGPNKNAPVQDSSSRLYTWVKAMEGKLNRVTREFETLKNSSITRENETKKDFKHLESEIIDLKHNQEQLTKKMDLIIKELKQTAGNEEVQVIKRYIEFWNPMNFVNQKDLDRYFDRKVAELNKMLEQNSKPAHKTSPKKH